MFLVDKSKLDMHPKHSVYENVEKKKQTRPCGEVSVSALHVKPGLPPIICFAWRLFFLASPAVDEQVPPARGSDPARHHEPIIVRKERGKKRELYSEVGALQQSCIWSSDGVSFPSSSYL